MEVVMLICDEKSLLVEFQCVRGTDDDDEMSKQLKTFWHG